MNDTELRAWLAGYESAWETRSPASAARLFTDDALYFETPFAAPFRGREGISKYWSTVTEDQRNVSVETEPVAVAGNTGVATWSARFELASSGNRVELSGVFILEFDEAGLCRRLREWWHAR